MEIRIIVIICVVIIYIGWVILISVRSFENNINKKIDKLNDISYKANDIGPCYRDVYSQLISMSHQIDYLIHNIENADNDKPKNKKMKINITASSCFTGKNKIIEAASIEEAIKILQIDKELVKSVIDERWSHLDDSIPYRFIIKTYRFENGCSYEIEIYDYYRE